MNRKLGHGTLSDNLLSLVVVSRYKPIIRLSSSGSWDLIQMRFIINLFVATSELSYAIWCWGWPPSEKKSRVVKNLKQLKMLPYQIALRPENQWPRMLTACSMAAQLQCEWEFWRLQAGGGHSRAERCPRRNGPLRSRPLRQNHRGWKGKHNEAFWVPKRLASEIANQ